MLVEMSHVIGAYLGLDVQRVEDTGDPATDIAERLSIASQELSAYDLIHVHTKAPDEAAHAKNPLAKKAVLEALDAGIGQKVKQVCSHPDVLVVVTADHSTPSSGSLIHSGEPVPLLMWGTGVRRDSVRSFDEISAAAGALGTVRGAELMYLILNHLDRVKLQGIMDTPVDQPYFPGDYEQFTIKNKRKKD